MTVGVSEGLGSQGQRDQRRFDGHRELSSAAERRGYARTAGSALLIAALSVLVLHVGPSMIAGPKRATGTSDVGLIAGYYSHESMLPFWWQGGISILGIILFAVMFRRYLLTFELNPWVAAMADFATAVAVAATPLYALSAGLESAMVQLASAGPAAHASLFGVFAAWDWIYNGFAYFFEAGYMAGWAIVAWRSGALPRWIAVVGGLVAIGHLFNSQVLMSHLADELTLVPTALFLLWFISTGVYLLRGGQSAAR
jgi:hypothetical protein